MIVAGNNKGDLLTMEKILVWDLPTRIGHWLLVATFAVAWLTGESEEWRLVHVAAGYAMAAILAWRIFWGLAGTPYARFSSFLFTPGQALEYLRGFIKGKSSHWVGHNPAGSYAIYSLILLGAATAASGWAVYLEMGGEWLEEGHEVVANVMLMVVILHVLGVVVSSIRLREKLILGMLNGYKLGTREQAITSTEAWWTVILLSLVGAAIWLAYNT